MTPEPSETGLAEATAWMQQGRFETARPLLQALVQSHPDQAAAWKALGVTQNKLGDAEAAQRSLRESLRLDPTDADAWSSLGGVYVTLGRHSDALHAFERGLASDPADTYALLNTLTMAALVGDFDVTRRRHAGALAEGTRRCDAQIAAGANLPWCWYDLAQIRFLQGAGDAFRAALGRAIGSSSEWQVASARKTYELLAGSAVLGAAASAALAEFARLANEPPACGR